MLYSITAASSRGCRRYMEDRVVIEYLRDENEDIDGIFVAVLDGHGGPHASSFVQKCLWKNIKCQEGFHSNDDSAVLESMRCTFLEIHDDMKEDHVRWPTRPNGHPSTAGTTVSCALIRKGKIYTAHCGDSRVVLVSESALGFTHEDLTTDHKPEDEQEMKRIQKDGGCVSRQTAVPRVIWYRHVANRVDVVPFLSIARSLGDYWSYVPSTEKYAVSPEPDVQVRPIGPKDRYLVLVTDGITHVMRSTHIAGHLWDIQPGPRNSRVRNPARYLLQKTINCWKDLKSDNMSIICVGFHPVDSNPFQKMHSHAEPGHLTESFSLEAHFTDSPKSIALLSDKRTRCVAPELDQLSVRVFWEESMEQYEGPGFVDEMVEDLLDNESDKESTTKEEPDAEEPKPFDESVLFDDEDQTKEAESDEEHPKVDEFDEEVIRALESADSHATNQPVRILNMHRERRQYLTVGSLNGSVQEKTVERTELHYASETLTFDEESESTTVRESRKRPHSAVERVEEKEVKSKRISS